MSGLRLLCLGVGDAFTALHYTSCFALESGGRWLLVDCPHPIRKIIREGADAAATKFDVDQIDGLLLTHLHGDHVSGLEILGFYFRYVLGRRLSIHTHADVAKMLWSGALAGSMEWSIEKAGAAPIRKSFDEFFELHLLDENQPADLGPFRVTCRKTIHTVPCIGFRVEAEGRRLAYSADTEFDPTLIDWLADADLIIHEASDAAFMHTTLASLMTVRPEVRDKMH